MSLLTWSRLEPERRRKSDWTMSLSRRLCHWSRRLISADNVRQVKNRARLLAFCTTSSLVCKPSGRKISSNCSHNWCCSSAETFLHCETILSSVTVTSSTEDSRSSARMPITTETTHDCSIKRFTKLTENNLSWLIEVLKNCPLNRINQKNQSCQVETNCYVVLFGNRQINSSIQVCSH